MPKREAWSRLTVMVSCGALATRSVAASVSCGSVRSFSSILVDHLLSSAMLESCNVYWKLPRAGRPPTAMSWTDCRIRDREGTLGDLNEHDAGQRHGGEEDAKGDRLVTQHDVERAPIAGGQAVERRFNAPEETAVIAVIRLHEA